MANNCSITECTFLSNIYPIHSSSNNYLTISHCNFANNSSPSSSQSPVTITSSNYVNIISSTFFNNSALSASNYGSALTIFNSNNVFINNCSFLNNNGTIGAVGLNSVTSYVEVNNCYFANNYAAIGAAITIFDSTPSHLLVVKESIFKNNHVNVNGKGGAIGVEHEDLSIEILNCSFEDNSGRIGW